jgi:hypothetical protein
MAMKREAIGRCTPPVPDPTRDSPWCSRQDIIEWLEERWKHRRATRPWHWAREQEEAARPAALHLFGPLYGLMSPSALRG